MPTQNLNDLQKTVATLRKNLAEAGEGIDAPALRDLKKKIRRAQRKQRRLTVEADRIAKQTPAKPEPAKAEAAKPEPAKPEAAKPEVAKAEAAKPEAAKPEAVKTEEAEKKEEPAKTEAVEAKPEAPAESSES